MDAGWAVFLAAVISAVGGIIVSLIAVFRKENQKDHDVVMGVLRLTNKTLGRVEDKVGRIDERLTDHVGSHFHK